MSLRIKVLSLVAIFVVGFLVGRPGTGELPNSGGSRPEPEPRKGALNAAPAIPGVESSSDRDFFTRSLHWMEQLGESDLGQCRALFEKFKDDPAKRKEIAERWAELDPRNLFDFLMGEGKEWARESGLREVLFFKWSGKDPKEAYQFAREVSHPDIRGEFLRELLGNLLYSDQELAKEIVGHETHRALLYVNESFQDYYKDDVAGASAFVHGLPDSLFKHHAAQLLAGDLGAKDPEQALAFVRSGQAERVPHLTEVVLKSWIKHDPEAAGVYMEENVSGASWGRLGAGLAGKLAEENPEEALAWVEGNLYGQARAEGLRTLIHEGADHHGEGVARIADDLPSGNLKTETIQELVKDWMQRDQAGAVSWVEHLKTDSARDAARKGFEAATLSPEVKDDLRSQLNF